MPVTLGPANPIDVWGFEPPCDAVGPMAIRTLVWFKRDLRERDHAPLAAAAQSAEAMGLWLIEPEWLKSAEFDPQHLAFALEGVASLRRSLMQRDLPLLVWQSDAIEALARIHEAWPFDTLVSHEETGPGWSWTRDRAVAAWCRDRGVVWHEHPQSGVIRRLKDRRGWAARWHARMVAPIVPVSARFLAPRVVLPEDWHRRTLQSLEHRPLAHRPVPTAGEPQALRRLSEFLHSGAGGYRSHLSSPLSAPHHCSRLSAHLAFGTVSMRTVFQATEQAVAACDDSGLRRDLRSFASRLRWHCHFMQKLEDEPQIEWRNFMRACDGLRAGDESGPGNPLDRAARERLQAWQQGRTGYPMVDACMRMLNATGWLNFRMRAMLVSFAAYHLWLHWRAPGEHLARQFLDFEPGIHWSQMQMQSGTTGINTLRIYSPSKQAIDQDPSGAFIRQWVPEIGSAAYPPPVVEERLALAHARQVMFGLRKDAAAKAEADRIQMRHGSRRSGLPPSPNRSRSRSAGQSSGAVSPPGPVQGELFE
jgi:deoxyribodipyrimidine photo-lyase